MRAPRGARRPAPSGSRARADGRPRSTGLGPLAEAGGGDLLGPPPGTSLLFPPGPEPGGAPARHGVSLLPHQPADRERKRNQESTTTCVKAPPALRKQSRAEKNPPNEDCRPIVAATPWTLRLLAPDLSSPSSIRASSRQVPFRSRRRLSRFDQRLPHILLIPTLSICYSILIS